jgi:uncharacterized protein YndB with AHSA1/START domain
MQGCSTVIDLNADAVRGILETRDGFHLLRLERHLDHPVEEVWAALIEPEQLVRWLAEAEIDPAVGGRVVLRWLNTDDRGNQAVMRGTITKLMPNSILEINSDIHGLLRWELQRDGSGCTLRFSSALPVPNDQVMVALAGWHIHLEHLADALDGKPVDWPNWMADHYDRWSELHVRYIATV